MFGSTPAAPLSNVISHADIDALRRDHLDGGALPAGLPFNTIPTWSPASVALWRVAGLARFWQDNAGKALAARQAMADCLAGLHAQRIPFVFIILGLSNRVNLFIGAYRDDTVTSGPAADRQTVAGVLRSGFPGIALAEAPAEAYALIPQAIAGAGGVGLLTGIPTEKLGTEQIGVEQMERLIRGLYGRQWGYLVVARPLPPGDTDRLFQATLSAQARATNEQTAVGQSPLAAAYLEMAQRQGERLAAGRAGGLWRVSPYVFGLSAADYAQAKGVAQAVFGGERSYPEPLRVLDAYAYRHLISQLGRPSEADGGGPQPYRYATPLPSAELATLAHLPLEEMPGYPVRDYARFDVDPPPAAGPRRLALGDVLDYDRPTGNAYTVDLDRLTQHTLVAGQTGTGKSHTIRHLLRGAWRQGVSFLVIEPAKAEYRQLLDDPDIGAALRVFTLGDERVAPFRLNPLAAPPGVSVLTHIDLLRSVFGAAFAMYGPMPQLLEQCLHAVYRDRGWNVATGENRRGIHPLSWPTLSDLYDVIDPIVAAMGYGPRLGPELQAALKVRVDSLRAGSKGLMLDTPVSVPMSELLARPTVLELEAIGDDDEKAFVMGVLWIFLYEHYRAAAGQSPGQTTDRLRHLTVIEEAHRLLTAAPSTANAEIANPRGKAVETFGNILSEIRAYGEGIILAEQIPSRLVEGAIKNTSLKIAHRLVASDERAIVGGAMNLDESQLRFLATLPRGRAAAFTEGDDRPALIAVWPGAGQGDSAALPGDASDVELIGAPGGVSALDIDIVADDDSIDILPDAPAIDWEGDGPILAVAPAAPPASSEITIDLPGTAPEAVLTIDTPAPVNQPLTAAERRLRNHMRAAFWEQPSVVASLAAQRYGEEELSALGRAGALAAVPELRAAVARLVLSTAHDEFNLAAGLGRLRALLGKYLAYDDPTATRPLAERLLGEWALSQVGRAYGWPYVEVAQLQRLWAAAVVQSGDALLSAITLGDAVPPTPYASHYRRLSRRSHDPFPPCGRVCPDGLCLYRYQIAALLGDATLDRAYRRGRAQAERNPATAYAAWAAELRHAGGDAVHLVLEDDVADTARRRAAACFLVQKGDALPAASRRVREREMKRGAAAALEDETP